MLFGNMPISWRYLGYLGYELGIEKTAQSVSRGSCFDDVMHLRERSFSVPLRFYVEPTDLVPNDSYTWHR